MGSINRLDEHLSNMIAAGEVVERPMGIVKELVENSIDAKATQVEIQIAQGGIDSIIIIDDGIGMDGADAVLAFERHATSKLKEVDDLWNIQTMGFRGEALPSIASVSHVLMRTSNGSESTEVEIQYGKIDHAKPVAAPQGTMLQIQHLFQKTPARFKHLKSPQYEFSLITDVVQKFALSHPEISFNLHHDGRTVFKTNGNGNLQEVLMQIYGREAAKTAIKIETGDQDYEITGYAIQPSYNRATKYYMLLYINERMIRNYRLQKAVIDAYSGYMPKDRYPIVILDIKMDAQLVDVNVHPSKWEIRLSKEKQLEKLLYTSLVDSLKDKLQVSEIVINKEKEKVEVQSFEFTYTEDAKIKEIKKEVNDSFANLDQLEKLSMEDIRNKIEEKTVYYRVEENNVENVKVEPISERRNSIVLGNEIPNPPISQEYIAYISQYSENITILEKENDEAPVAFKQEKTSQALVIPKEEKTVNQSLPQMNVIGQFHNCYILAEGEAGLYVIDQHAAQERYHFEQIQAMILNGVMDQQPLLVPITIDTSIAAVAMIDELNVALSIIGIEVEEFGNNAFVCRQVPIWMQDTDEKGFLEDMIEFWMKDQEVNMEKMRHHAIATMACHSSIRFNRSLNQDEMKQVIEDLRKCEQPFHCPHGRPTMICLSDKHLFKEFQRGG